MWERRDAWPPRSKKEAENNLAFRCVTETVGDRAFRKGGGLLCLGDQRTFWKGTGPGRNLGREPLFGQMKWDAGQGQAFHPKPSSSWMCHLTQSLMTHQCLFSLFLTHPGQRQRASSWEAVFSPPPLLLVAALSEGMPLLHTSSPREGILSYSWLGPPPGSEWGLD